MEKLAKIWGSCEGWENLVNEGLREWRAGEMKTFDSIKDAISK